MSRDPTQQRTRVFEPRANAIGAVLILLVIASSLWFQGGGFLQLSESHYFLQFHLADRPFFERIFDVAQNDWGLYQARELSYLVDDLDAWFIAISTRFGAPHFYPVSHYLGLAGIALIYLRYSRRTLASLPAFHRIVLALVFLTGPAAYFGMFFRSSKILVALLVTGVIWIGFFGREQLRRRDVAQLLVLSFAMTLADRQGFVFGLALGGIAFLAWCLEREIRFLTRAAVFFGASLLNVIYNFYIGPWLIELTNGYRPDLGYQDPSFVLEGIAGTSMATFDASASLLVLPEVTAFFFGNVGTAGGIAILVFFAVCLSLPAARRPSNGKEPLLRRYSATILFFAGLAAMTALNWITVLRLSPVLRIENKLVYYSVPAAALIFFAAAVCLDRLLRSAPRLRLVSGVALSAVLASNVLALPRHESAYLYAGNTWPGWEQGPQLLECLEGLGPEERSRGLDAKGEEICRFLRRKGGLAEIGDAGPDAAAFDAATRYLIGDGVPKDVSAAIEGYRRIAEAGYTPAQVSLSEHYRLGFGVEQDAAKALAWLVRAAESGHAPSQFALANLHQIGASVARSDELAVQWFRRAAEGEYAPARRALGRRYMKGEGVQRDLVLAHLWFSLGMQRGAASESQFLERLEREMDAEAIAEAKHRAAQWRKAAHAGG